ncbi:MAG: MATE family efflux transporter [Lachnospiraceae bacterium]|nr:MATE family efflux transporter [Lachnospiraceae bacterium]
MKTLREYAKYTSLNVLGMLGLSCYILADTFFVAKGLGSNGLAALNLAIPVYSLIHGTGLMLAMGGATRFSILKNQKTRDSGNQAFSQTVVLAGAFALVFVLAGVVGTGTITSFLGADEAVYEMCQTYLKVLLLFSPVFLLNDLLLCFVRNDGNPQLAMAAMLGGSFSNIILDYVFIFQCKMGIFGAVLATGFAPVIGMGIQSIHFIRRKNTFHLVKTQISAVTALQLMSGGMPSLVAELSSGIVIVVFNSIMLSLRGNTGVAAYGVIANLSLVVISVFTGIAQGIQPVVSKYYGAGESDRISAVYRYAVLTVAVLSAFIYAGTFFGAGQIAALFNSEGNQQLQDIAVKGLRLYFTACIFAGFNIVTSIYFTSIDRAKPGNIISLLRGIVLIVPLAYLMSGMFGLTGLWLTFPLTELLTAAAALALYFKYGAEKQQGKNKKI